MNSESFQLKIKITGKALTVGNTKDIEIVTPLNFLSNFWRTLEMSLINCEFNIILSSSADFVISCATGATKSAITDAKLYVLIKTLWTQNSATLLRQLKSGFKTTIK